MESEYSLKWNNHKSCVLTAVNQLFSAQRHADCILAAEGKPLRVHKLIISACSPYLESLLEENLFDKGGAPIIIFNDVTFVELKALCEYMYKGEVNVPQENFESFIKIAHTLKIRGLYDQGGGEVNKQPPERASPSPAPIKRKQPETPQPSQPVKRVTLPKRGSAVTVAPIKKVAKQEEPSDSHDSPTTFQKWENPRASLLARNKAVSITPKEKVQPIQPPTPQPQEQEDELEAEYPEGYQDSSSVQGGQETVEFTTWNEGSNEFSGNDNSMSEQELTMYCCMPCGKMYKKIKSLRSHLRYECGKDPEYPCPHCPYKSKQKGYLNQHISIKHGTNAPLYTCDICGYSTKYKSNYNIHMRSPHSKLFKESKDGMECRSCSKKFGTVQSLKFHMEKCSGDGEHDPTVFRVYACPSCEYKAKFKGNVVKHIRVKHTNMMTCGYCPYQTKIERLMRGHLLTRHRITEEEVIQPMLVSEQRALEPIELLFQKTDEEKEGQETHEEEQEIESQEIEGQVEITEEQPIQILIQDGETIKIEESTSLQQKALFSEIIDEACSDIKEEEEEVCLETEEVTEGETIISIIEP